MEAVFKKEQSLVFVEVLIMWRPVLIMTVAVNVTISIATGARAQTAAAPATTVITSPAAAPPDVAMAPELQQAQLIQQQIAEYEAAVNKHVEEINTTIDQAIANYNPGNWDSEKTAIESFRPLVQVLNQWAGTLLTHRSGYADSLAGLGAAVGSSSESYRAAATLFRRYAEEERFADIKEDYVLVADSWEQLAKAMDNRGPLIAQEQKDIANFFDLVGSSSVFLGRLDQHLAAYPTQGSIHERESHLRQVQRYVEGFDKLRAHLRAFNAKLASSEPADSSAKTPAAASDFVGAQPHPTTSTQKTASHNMALSTVASLHLPATSYRALSLAAVCMVSAGALKVRQRRRNRNDRRQKWPAR